MEITKIEDIRAHGAEDIVELSGWNEEPFVCRLRRVGLYEMMAAGCVPNPLIPVVRDLFMGMGKAVQKDLSDPEDVQAFLALARAALVEPGYQDLQEAGILLTDQQILEIFFYATRGVRALSTFRRGAGAGIIGHGEAIRDEAQPDDGN